MGLHSGSGGMQCLGHFLCQTLNGSDRKQVGRVALDERPETACVAGITNDVARNPSSPVLGWLIVARGTGLAIGSRGPRGGVCPPLARAEEVGAGNPREPLALAHVGADAVACLEGGTKYLVACFEGVQERFVVKPARDERDQFRLINMRERPRVAGSLRADQGAGGEHDEEREQEPEAETPGEYLSLHRFLHSGHQSVTWTPMTRSNTSATRNRTLRCALVQELSVCWL